jgi:uncharacterized protein YwqG
MKKIFCIILNLSVQSAARIRAIRGLSYPNNMKLRNPWLIIALLIGLSGCSGESRPPATRVPDGDYADVVQALQANGFGEIAERVLQNRTDTVILQTRPGAAIQPGASKIGGTPDFTGAIQWPKDDGKSLAFIAQINLNEIAAIWPQSPLPKAGMLYFFYDTKQSVWGYDPEDKGKWAVEYLPEITYPMKETSFPDDLPEYARYKAIAVEPVRRDDFPGYYQIDTADLTISKPAQDRLWDIFQAFSDEGSTVHKLLGFPDEIQGDMQTEVQLVSHGLYVGDASGYNDPRAEELRKTAYQWKLLLQIDSDDDAGMMWGDVGRIYYWIHESDLANGVFDNTWLILQCY